MTSRVGWRQHWRQSDRIKTLWPQCRWDERRVWWALWGSNPRPADWKAASRCFSLGNLRVQDIHNLQPADAEMRSLSMAKEFRWASGNCDLFLAFLPPFNSSSIWPSNWIRLRGSGQSFILSNNFPSGTSVEDWFGLVVGLGLKWKGDDALRYCSIYIDWLMQYTW